MNASVESLKTGITPLTSTQRPIPYQRRPFRDSSYCTWLGSKRLYTPARIFRDLGLKPDFSDVPANVMWHAATRGKLVEEYCYRLLMGKPVTIRSRHTGSFQAEVSERVEIFYRWMQKVKPEYVDHQTMVWNEKDRIAWTRDLRCLINGKLWLVDIKCTSLPARDWPLQLGCGLSYDEDGCGRAAILQLKPGMNKQGYKFRDSWSGEQLKEWWRRTVSRWHSNRDYQLLRNELGFDSEAFGLETEDENDD